MKVYLVATPTVGKLEPEVRRAVGEIEKVER
jgi:hypothetical protein